MRNRRDLIIIAAVTFAIGLVALFPARVAYHWFVPPGVAVSNISGTVWSGAAGEASINQLYLHDLRWSFQPSSIFSGGFGFHLEAKPVSGFVDAIVIAGLGNSVEIRDLTASMPLEVLGSAIKISGLRGSASLKFERLEMSEQTLEHAAGTLSVANVSVPLIGRDILGGYRAEFSTQSDGVTASVEDTDNVIDLAGTLIIRPDRSYDLEGLVIATPTTPNSIRQQMELLGPANNRGQREIRLGGTY